MILDGAGMAALLRHRMGVDALFYGWRVQFATQSSTGQAPSSPYIKWLSHVWPNPHGLAGRCLAAGASTLWPIGHRLHAVRAGDAITSDYATLPRLSPRPRLVLESVPRLEFCQVAPPLRRAPPTSSPRVRGSPPPPPLCPIRQRNELNSSIQAVGLRYDIANRMATR
jgi:hypothetical protein